MIDCSADARDYIALLFAIVAGLAYAIGYLSGKEDERNSHE